MDSRTSDSRRELACILLLVAIFMCFTWRSVTMFFSGDDLMNMYKAWTTPALKIWKAQLLPWMPELRPLGAAVYRVSYSLFGFEPRPLYVCGWLLLIGNVFVAWRFFRALAPSAFVALTALSLTLVHGLFQDLYLSMGTIYDRLCFLFTLLAVIAYVRFRRDGKGAVWPGTICVMAMNSKESGAVVPLILFAYEGIYLLPDVWREHRIRSWLRSVAPFYTVMGLVLVAFVFGRVRGTPDLAANRLYQPHISVGAWLSNLAEYFNILLYRQVHFNAAAAAITLVAMLAAAAFLPNRAMLFGLAYFLIAITPVALITARPGYVLYVPLAGLGLYFATLFGLATSQQSLVYAAVTALMVWIHAAHWPEPWPLKDSLPWRLTDKMRRDYPAMKAGAKILFVDDYAFPNGYDTMFNLRLLYGDPSIEVFKLNGPPVLQPDPVHPPEFDHVFTTRFDSYVELDRRSLEESIRLNVLEDYPPGKLFDVDRADRIGYPVSGLLATERRGDGWWTTRSAKLKFDLYPADATLNLKFAVPNSIVAGGAKRNLSVSVDGVTVGTVALSHVGDTDSEFPVPARAINAFGFTMLELNVDTPLVQGGQEYGVVLKRAGFEYARK